MRVPPVVLDDVILTEIQAADVLRLSSRTLQAWRAQGRGPAYVKAGRAIRYRRRALVEWLNANTCDPAHSEGLNPLGACGDADSNSCRRSDGGQERY